MRGLKWVTVSRMIAQGLTWANTFFVIRLISQDDFGLAALAGVFANFLSLLNELGFSVALIQKQTRDDETLRNVFGALLLVGAVLTTGLVLCAPLVGIATHEPRVVPLMRVVALQFVSMSFSVIPQSRLSMDMRFKEIGIAGVISAVIGGATTLAFALNGAGAWGLIVGTVALSLSRAALLNMYCPSVRMPQFRFSKIRGFARFSGLVLLERSLWYWYMQLDSFIVARSLGAAQLGIYAVGRQLTNIPLERAMEIINAVALPAFSAVKDDRDQVRLGYLKVLRVGAGYAFPVFWGLAVVCDPLVRLVLGEKWAPAVPVIQLLCISMPLRMLNSFTSATVLSIGRNDVNIKSLLFAIVVIPTGILIGRRWGVQGVAAAWAIGFPLVYLLNATLIHRALELKASLMVTAVWPPALASLLMVALLVGLDRWFLGTLPSYAHLAVGVLAGALVFGLALWFLSRRTAVEIFELARGMLPGRA